MLQMKQNWKGMRHNKRFPNAF